MVVSRRQSTHASSARDSAAMSAARSDVNAACEAGHVRASATAMQIRVPITGIRASIVQIAHEGTDGPAPSEARELVFPIRGHGLRVLGMDKAGKGYW